MRLQSTCLCVGLARNASVSDSDLITEKGVAVLPHLTEVLSYSHTAEECPIFSFLFAKLARNGSALRADVSLATVIQQRAAMARNM